MSDFKPILLYGDSNGRGPNPKKVQILLEELNIPYTIIDTPDPKTAEYEKINPNGRLPSIIDPNTDITLWESGAIVEYLVDTYDKENKLTVDSLAEKWHLKQYSYFQASGQGPYYGQAVWFTIFDKTNEPAAKRYYEQIERVLKVLDNILEGKEYLVGGKCTYADLMFIPWNQVVVGGATGPTGAWKDDSAAKYPSFFAWHQRLLERPSVKKLYGL